MKKEDALPVATAGAGLPSAADQFAFMQLTDPTIINENTGQEGINPYDLPRIKMPAGGGIAWMIPNLDGEPQVTKSISGIIIHWRDVRSYWPDEYTGDSVPPACSSKDCVTGEGEPGGQCAVCPMAQFGSGKNGGQACKMSRMLFFMTKDSALPIVLVAPPTSIKPIRQYFIGLSGRMIPYYGCVTNLSIVQEKNKGGVQFSMLRLAKEAVLSKEDMAVVKAYTANIAGALSKVEVEASDLKGCDVN